MPEFKDTMPGAFELKGMTFKNGQKPMKNLKSSPLHEETDTDPKTDTSQSAGSQIAGAAGGAAGAAIGQAVGDALFKKEHKPKADIESSAKAFSGIDY